MVRLGWVARGVSLLEGSKYLGAWDPPVCVVLADISFCVCCLSACSCATEARSEDFERVESVQIYSLQAAAPAEGTDAAKTAQALQVGLLTQHRKTTSLILEKEGLVSMSPTSRSFALDEDMYVRLDSPSTCPDLLWPLCVCPSVSLGAEQ